MNTDKVKQIMDKAISYGFDMIDGKIVVNELESEII